MAMDYIRNPTQFFYGFQYSAYIEDRTIVIIFILISILIADRGFPLEEILVVNKVNLHPGRLNGCYLNDQRMVRVVNNKIHTRQTDNLVQLIAALVDISEFWHECPDFATTLLNSLRQISTYCRDLGFGKVGSDFLGYKQDFFCINSVN